MTARARGPHQRPSWSRGWAVQHSSRAIGECRPHPLAKGWPGRSDCRERGIDQPSWPDRALGFVTKRLAPRAGFEPATIRLTVECSTAELPRNRRNKCSRAGAYNKAFRACKGPNHWRRGRPGPGRKGAAAEAFVAISCFGPVTLWRNPGIRREHGASRQFDLIGRDFGTAGFHGS